MTSSFSLANRRLLIALTPASVHEAFAVLGIPPDDAPSLTSATLRKRGVPEKIAALWQRHLHRCHPEKILAACERERVRVLYPNDPGWPNRFAHLGAQMPSALFVRGQIPEVPYLAVIGTRRPTGYGERVTDELIRSLADSPVGIVSGLAFGTDGRAHERALDHGLPTVAILGSSVCAGELYPPAHATLADRIIAQGGGIVSEYPPGSAIHQGTFPARNRLIAALSQAVIVIEARDRSGTLITARIALELGRDVLAVPGSIFSDASHGTHALLTAGARLCRHANDIWETLAVDPPQQARQARDRLPLSEQDRALMDHLEPHPDGLALDDLATHLKTEPGPLVSRLGLLELQGLVRQGPSGRWLRCGLA